ncbi:Pol polyprotein [Elysia marginata]|uniref:Pol polyprotein n=1 Tax=Elysia marginata TaxID=1093978 RepID=A0AAV4HDN4_9GAST|nr:Pol polyprotein [Elysia marginata]
MPLRNIDTVTVAEALVDIFSRTGIPQEILSDRGTQFTSDLMGEICRLLSMKKLTTSPYHPQCNGLVERFNATLKSMLKRPYEVIEKTGPNVYQVDTGATQKSYHANLLKKYYDRAAEPKEIGILQCAVASVIDEDEGEELCHDAPQSKLEMPSLAQTETIKDVVISDDLSQRQQEELNSLLVEYKDVLTDVPGRTNSYTYDILYSYKEETIPYSPSHEGYVK